MAGQAYSFQPTASDANNDVLGFGISNKPAWATFSSATGLLSGTPAAADVGTYANIVIAVSDSHSSVTLAPFTIVVTANTSGTARISWVAPTTNADGSPITNLSGYQIYYGNSSAALNQVVSINDPAATTYTVTGLSSGTWYFALKSLSSAGLQSALSPAGSKTIT